MRSVMQKIACLVGLSVLLVLMQNCGGGTNTSGDGTNQGARIHTQKIDTFDATQVHPEAKGYQLADYDPKSKKVIFYPWGDIVTNPHGVLLAYHTDKDFFSPQSYDAVDLTVLVDPDAQGFGTGFIDSMATWSYFVPFRKRYQDFKQVPNDLAVRFNLSKEIKDATAYEVFRLSAMTNPPPQLGWITGAFANEYAFYLPYGTPIATDPWHLLHGILLRYDSRMEFDNPDAWSWFDLKQVDTNAVGFQSIAAKGNALFLVPYYPGKDVLVRYDLTMPLNSIGSYQKVKLTDLHPEARGYTGAIIAGEFLILVPWRNINLANQADPNQSASVAAAYDTRKSLNDPTAWSFIDLKDIDSRAKGYQFGWYDRNGFVHFVPSHDFSVKAPPPFVVWNSKKSFTDPKAWLVFSETSGVSSTGAAYDGNFTAWLAPYGKAGDAIHPGNSGLITRVKFE